ncbi:uncharacterized protein PFL1_03494 [Pseudozyma flocculosa PF-1]|uniref:Uncharacterized protein n=1 Tax=Pseudozyma flocculosa PF-1 TaxID=1277687 RepID=A0A061H8J1_9BASI|nr:uncharacterized protein PFL1_03494 [Pseudozyma flocculosa PF-1]EPQ29207.1 hypothetical protein PFL1_03494 [Pseudozyma flocculosa PF-1]
MIVSAPRHLLIFVVATFALLSISAKAAPVEAKPGRLLSPIERRHFPQERQEIDDPNLRTAEAFGPPRGGESILTGSPGRFDLDRLLNNHHIIFSRAHQDDVGRRIDMFKAYRRALADSLGLSEDDVLSPRLTPREYNDYLFDITFKLANAETEHELLALPFRDALFRHHVETVPDAQRRWMDNGVSGLMRAIEHINGAARPLRRRALSDDEGTSAQPQPTVAEERKVRPSTFLATRPGATSGPREINFGHMQGSYRAYRDALLEHLKPFGLTQDDINSKMTQGELKAHVDAIYDLLKARDRATIASIPQKDTVLAASGKLTPEAMEAWRRHAVPSLLDKLEDVERAYPATTIKKLLDPETIQEFLASEATKDFMRKLRP